MLSIVKNTIPHLIDVISELQKGNLTTAKLLLNNDTGTDVVIEVTTRFAGPDDVIKKAKKKKVAKKKTGKKK